ncbi:MAG: hypothetical protein HS111_19455 [Kofleriaceae bacterium]|nr:hypothetical protein [Kofleriaceae bacterium]
MVEHVGERDQRARAAVAIVHPEAPAAGDGAAPAQRRQREPGQLVERAGEEVVVVAHAGDLLGDDLERAGAGEPGDLGRASVHRQVVTRRRQGVEVGTPRRVGIAAFVDEPDRDGVVAAAQHGRQAPDRRAER